MSTDQIRILFDKEDRTYRSNEPISGKIVVDAHTDLSCREFQIRFGWRTHGRGNTDKSEVETLTLPIENIKFQKGEYREFPFKFQCPAGPVTYHGHNINIDWYMKAAMDIPHARDITSDEEDFLLVGKDPPQDQWSANTPDTNTYYPHSSPVVATSSTGKSVNKIRLAGIIFLMVLFGGIFLVSYFFSIRLYAAAILTVAFIIAFFMLRRIFNFTFKLKVDIKEAQVTPLDLHPGEQARCRIVFETKSSVFLDRIAVLVSADEHAVSGYGTRSQSFSFNIYNKQYTRQYSEELAAGRVIAFDLPLPIPADAPPTFIASNNSVRWNVNLKIECHRWPSWGKTIPIIISAR